MTYAYDHADYVVGLPSRIAQCSDPQGVTVLADQRFQFDNLADGEVTVGDVTREDVLIKYPGEMSRWSTTLYSYDAFGNRVTTEGPEGQLVVYTYWERANAYPKD